MKPSARRQSRHYALQAMYQWQLSGNSVHEIEQDFVERQIKKDLDMDYFKDLIRSVPAQQEEIDLLIAPHLSRPIKEIDPVELAILRLATYELKQRLDVPYRVVLNEAMDLTKRFGSVEGYKFVNGVLDQIARSLRALEVAEDAKR